MASLPEQLPMPPAGTNWLATINNEIAMLLSITMLSSFCVPMLLALFFFSSQHKCRRTPIFYLNVSVLLLGIVQAIYCVTIVTHNLLHPENRFPQGYLLFYYGLSFFTPILVEVVLIFRLHAVFTHPKYNGKRVYIVGFPIAMKFVRLLVAILALVLWYQGSQRMRIMLASGTYGWNMLPYPRIGWALQVLDNGYCSLAFLIQLRKRIKNPGGILRNGDLLRRLRGIFCLALSNFVIPCVLSLIHLILASLDVSSVAWFYNCNYLMIVNNYMSIIGVVFATIWATSIEWATVKGMCGCNGEIAWDASFASSNTAGSRPSRPYSMSKKLRTPSRRDSVDTMEIGQYPPGSGQDNSGQDDDVKVTDPRRFKTMSPIPVQIRVDREKSVTYEPEVESPKSDSGTPSTSDSFGTITEDARIHQ